MYYRITRKMSIRATSLILSLLLLFSADFAVLTARAEGPEEEQPLTYQDMAAAEPELGSAATAAINISSQPKDVSAAVSEPFTFSVEAASTIGKSLSYQWQFHYAGKTTWTNWGTGKTITKTASASWNGLTARCVITDSAGNQRTTREAVLWVPARITEQPEDVCRQKGETFTFSTAAVSTQGTTLSYQWQYHYAGKTTWTNWGTGKSITKTANESWDGLVARCVITDGDGHSVYTREAVLSIPITITKQPGATTPIAAGQSFTLDAEAESSRGLSLSYKWQYHYADSTNWVNWGTGKSITKTASGSWEGLVARCAITDSQGNTVYTRETTLAIQISILQQPKDKSVDAGSPFTFTARASSTQGLNLTYQWQYHYASSTSWSNWGMGDSITKTASANWDGLVARCVITDSKGYSVVTKEVTLTVIPAPQITTQPKNTTIESGKNFTLTIAARSPKNLGLSYQWQFHYAGKTTWTNWGTGTSITKTASASWDGLVARCVVTDTAGNQKISNEVTLTLDPIPVVTTQPKNTTIESGKNFTLTIAARSPKNLSLSYQWQFHYAGKTTWTNWGTGTSITKTASASWDGLVARCVVTDTAGNQKISNEITLTLDPTPVITTQPKNTTIEAGESFTLTIAAKSPKNLSLSYQWQYHYAGATKWTNWGNGTSITKTASASWDGLVARCVVTDTAGNQKISNEVTLTVLPVSVKGIKINQNDPTLYVGESITLTAAITPTNAANKAVTWKSSNTSVATVSSTGVVTGKATGTATITVTANDKTNGTLSDTITVKVNSAIKVTQNLTGSKQFDVGEQFTITATATGGVAPYRYQWQYRTSSSGTWTSASQTGANTATISLTATAALEGYQYRCKVTDANNTVSYSTSPLKLGVVVYRALLIGNYDYYDPNPNDDHNPDLVASDDNVNQLYKMLIETKEPYTSSTITTKFNATAAEMRSLIRSAFSGADANDVCLFYFSGHGLDSADTDLVGALCDINIEKWATGWQQNNIVTTGELADLFDEVCPESQMIILLDSCHSGAGVVKLDSVNSSVSETDLQRYNNAIIDSFREHDRQNVNSDADDVMSGELMKSRFYVITAACWDCSGWQVFWSDGSGFSLMLRFMAEGLGYSASDNNYSSPYFRYNSFSGKMPADTSSDSKVTLKELFNYIKSSTYTFIVNWNNEHDEDHQMTQSNVQYYGVDSKVLFSR